MTTKMSVALLWASLLCGCGGPLVEGVDDNMVSVEVECPAAPIEGDYHISDDASLEALRGRTHVQGELLIHGTALTALGSLGCLHRVDGDLTITSNEALESVSGLHDLESVGGILRVADNPSLTEMGGLGMLRSAGGLDVRRNAALRGLDRLPITELNGPLLVADNGALRTVHALRSLTAVAGNIDIHGNAVLYNLDGLGWVNHVGGNIRIHQNGALVSIEGLRNVAHFGGTLTVSENPALPACTAQQLASRLQSLGWEGSLEESAAPCTSQ